MHSSKTATHASLTDVFLDQRDLFFQNHQTFAMIVVQVFQELDQIGRVHLAFIVETVQMTEGHFL